VSCYVGEYGVPADEARWFPILDDFLHALDNAGIPGTYWAAGDAWDWSPSATADQLDIQPRDALYTDRPQLATLMAHLPPGLFRSISAAGSFGYRTAPGSLVAGFDKGLYNLPSVAAAAPWPVTLDGVAVELTDSNNATWNAAVLAAAPGQVNYQVPAGAAPGLANVVVFHKGKAASSGVLAVGTPAAALFTANWAGNGIAGGVAAATIQRTHNGEVSYEETAVYSASQGMFVARPIAIGSDTISLILYGTGFDSVTAPSAVTIATLYTANGSLTGGATLAASSVGPVGAVTGIDQITIPIPASYAGTGAVSFTLVIGAQTVNPVTVSFQ
jgi:uncharacterized protein (TIGR03437 family)